MDMRGCAATPRRPSGHLQKQNGYLVSQRHREMATEPCFLYLKMFNICQYWTFDFLRTECSFSLFARGWIKTPNRSCRETYETTYTHKSEPSFPPLPLWWVAATSAVFLHTNVWRCIAPEFWKELKKTTAEWNKRKVETKLRSFLVLGVSGGC
ncbi:hypothetical protein ALC60_03576 [Trachymyrmex zeteki]|uniref:Uncharacterized protein n=1 Tax=Mycetomoellerius zeteki TaxID=64791 RepID=A0A151XB96_9HYME|nr:hypothetical protein ALC60_03576 [Trachymyrmex zeteki]